MRVLLLGALALVLAALSAVAKTVPEPQGIDPAALIPICVVATNPAAYDGQEIVVRGVWASDYFEYTSLTDPTCRPGLAPWNTAGGSPIGERAFSDVLCDEEGGLVEVTIRGRIESRPGQFPASRFYVLEYSDPRHVALDPSWLDAWGVLRREAEQRWDSGSRAFFCRLRGYVDMKTGARRFPPSH